MRCSFTFLLLHISVHPLTRYHLLSFHHHQPLGKKRRHQRFHRYYSTDISSAKTIADVCSIFVTNFRLSRIGVASCVALSSFCTLNVLFFFGSSFLSSFSCFLPHNPPLYPLFLFFTFLVWHTFFCLLLFLLVPAFLSSFYLGLLWLQRHFRDSSLSLFF